MRSIDTSLLYAVALFLFFTGCDPSAPGQNEQKNNNATTQKPSLPADLFTKTTIPEAKSVLEARKEGKVGEKITITGFLGGREEPFTSNRATFLLADISLPPCTDGCKAPWDACCETPETIAKNVATIQVADEKGNPLKCDIKNQGGLKPMSTITIEGIVSQKDDQVLVINAQHIYVKP
ncbi:MAG: hypothetical protein AABZ60_14245 [Planctomycetota bacterium]